MSALCHVNELHVVDIVEIFFEKDKKDIITKRYIRMKMTLFKLIKEH